MPRQLPTKAKMARTLSRASKLPPKFYQRDTVTVAKEVLGKTLVHIYRGKRYAGKIVEVEAYLGARDKAAHTYKHRRTKRTEPMFWAGGHAYVYFVYGMYDCINVVTQKEGVAQAVLLRALEPISPPNADMSGPGKLCRAMKIKSKMSGTSLNSKHLFLEDAPTLKPKEIVRKKRIGVDYAGGHAHWKLRFYIKNNPYISKK